MLEINKVYNMDCVDGIKLLDDNSIDLVIIDPPYKLDIVKLTNTTKFNNYANELLGLKESRTKDVLKGLADYIEIIGSNKDRRYRKK